MILAHDKFVDPDPEDPEWSMTEVDLAARLDLTIQRHIPTNTYHLRGIRNRESQFHGTLSEVVQEANRLEGADHLEVWQ